MRRGVERNIGEQLLAAETQVLARLQQLVRNLKNDSHKEVEGELADIIANENAVNGVAISRRGQRHSSERAREAIQPSPGLRD